MRTEAEIGVVQPQAKEHVGLQKPEEAGGILPGSLGGAGGCGPADTLMSLGFWPPELSENPFLLF